MKAENYPLIGVVHLPCINIPIDTININMRTGVIIVLIIPFIILIVEFNRFIESTTGSMFTGWTTGIIFGSMTGSATWYLSTGGASTGLGISFLGILCATTGFGGCCGGLFFNSALNSASSLIFAIICTLLLPGYGSTHKIT